MSDDSVRKRRARFTTVFVFVGVCAVLILIQYGSLMLRNPEEASGTLSVASVERGPILDRNGKILAIQTSLDSVTAWKPYVRDIQRTSELLAQHLDLSAAAIEATLDDAAGFVVIRRAISPTASTAIRELIEDGSLTGIDLRPDMGRTYPERDRGAHVVGYTGTENVGLAGIEYAFNDVLAPSVSSPTRETVYGNQVFLTIDANVQNATNRLARATLEEHDARSVTILVMDAQNADMVAYTSIPTFDPNSYAEYSEEQRRNRPIGTLYEPGSVFKIFSIASFLQLGGITPRTSFSTDGIYRGVEPPISDLGNYGTITAEGIIKFSSNVGAAYASETVDADSFFHMLKLFGFGEPTGIGFSGEERGILNRPERWSGRSKPTIAIGQEVGVTALQMVTAATALANRGVLLKPNIVRRIVSHDGRLVEAYGREPVRQVLDPGVAETMLELMHAATGENGTARRITIDGLRISAKTGTAEIFDTEIGAYSEDEFLASCLAIFPTDDPRYIVYVVIERPRGEEYFGGRIAVPVVRNAVEFLLSYEPELLGGTRVAAHSGRVRVRTFRLPEIGDTMPDLVGLPKRVLLPLYEDDRFAIDIRGTGWVVAQDPDAGSAIESGTTIRLELE
mgnify:CR=1 FL=1